MSESTHPKYVVVNGEIVPCVKELVFRTRSAASGKELGRYSILIPDGQSLPEELPEFLGVAATDR